MRGRAFATFKNEIIPVNNVIGIDGALILFNEEENGEFKLQLTQFIFVENEQKDLIELDQVREFFELINENNEVLINSEDLRSEKVQLYLEMLNPEMLGDIN